MVVSMEIVCITVLSLLKDNMYIILVYGKKHSVVPDNKTVKLLYLFYYITLTEYAAMFLRLVLLVYHPVTILFGNLAHIDDLESCNE